MIRMVVLISGQGTNLQALIDASTQLNIHIVAVISNKADAYGLQRAQQAGITTKIITASKASFDAELLAVTQAYQPDLVVLAGFMRILTAAFVQQFTGRLINIHPSLLPHHKGLHTHERALAAGDTQHGCSVHFVTEDLDGGPIIARASCNISTTDTAEQLKAQVAILEHQLLPLCVGWFAHGQIQLVANTVLWQQQVLPSTGVTFESHQLAQMWQSYAKNLSP